MKFDPSFEQGTLLARYKRFFADVLRADGDILTVHCPNTGSMKHCVVPHTPCWFSLSDNPRRKLAGTLEITTTPQGYLAGVNTGRANQLVREAIDDGAIAELAGYATVLGEVRYGAENSRIDLLLSGANRRDCYVEVKNVTFEQQGGLITFPDAVTSRGTKHLRELIATVRAGHRAVLLFCVQHSGAQRVAPADDIDPLYGRTLREAISAGVEVVAYGCRMTAEEIVIDRRLDVVCP
ncbi:MAG: DNA/RNA nuclease SfsA [Porticoccaceae bacterium]|jgi:sugar fermentation stimulation protein A